MAAQVGSVAWCIYHMARSISEDEIRQMVGYFTDIESGVFRKVVRPGDKVAAMAEFGEDGYFRGNRLASHVEIQFMGGPQDGETVFTGRMAGMFVPRGAGGY
jgi:hypothetical protein